MEIHAVLNTIVDVTLVLELMAFAMRARDFASKKGNAVKVVAMLKYVVMASPHLQNKPYWFKPIHGVSNILWQLVVFWERTGRGPLSNIDWRPSNNAV